MFSFMRKIAIQRRKRSISGSLSTTILGLIETPSSPVFRFISAISSTNLNLFAVSYLTNSFGLSPAKARSVSKRRHFGTSSTDPDSVITLLRNNGYNQTQISIVIQRHPHILSANMERTLKPKFDFFNSVGLSPPHLAKVLSASPNILMSSLDKTIIPSFNFLKSMLHTENRVVSVLKRSLRVLLKDQQKKLEANTALLRAYAVPESNIEYLLVTHPRSFLKSASRFKEIVEDVRKLGFSSSQYKFVVAVMALASMTKPTLEAKFDVYRRWGWSEDEIRCAFRKVPICMVISAKNIMLTMEFLVDKMGYDRLPIVNNPRLLMFSMEKRIIPRCLVIQVLNSKGLVDKEPSLSALLYMTENGFVQKFVTGFEENVPDLLDVYQGKGRHLA